MSKIIKLPTKIISQIAAGEVIERPANIVKELVENSIDAQADKIHIIIKDGGLNQVYVRDNGTGIPENEVLKAFELHTTSKLFDDQIKDVQTLGFRGEGLASIASISKVICKSKNSSSHKVNEITIEGGDLVKQQTTIEKSEKSWTSVKITGLFYNTPVRRKFLKKTATERKRIIDMVTHFALTYPNIHFILEEEAQNKFTTRLESPSRQSLLAVIFDVLGSDIASELIVLDSKLKNWHVSGYISKPNLFRSDRSVQFLCINGRIVRHQELQKKIENAYGSQLMRSAHPILVLNISGPIDAIDFNIHPQKSEIRFKSNDTILSDLSELTRTTLDTNAELVILPLKKVPIKDKIGTQKMDDLFPVTSDSEDISHLDTELIQEENSSRTPSTGDIYKQLSLSDNKQVVSKSGIEILGHIMNKFALAYANDELWLIDIHAADERVKFEYYEKGSQRTVLSQQMLQPISISLAVGEKQFILDHKIELEKFGLRISNDSDTSILVHSTPVYFDQEISELSIKKVLLDIAGFFGETVDDQSIVESPLNKIEYGIVARLACHGSIRSGYPLSNEVIAKVIDNLLKCTNPWTCAHGRPTILRLPKSRLEGWFRR
ncbi:MAG: DNA mismatch repair protein MutL [Candidatus Heimdallarchaeota archaeon LC_2]|nr:MAG: DNA mismatch repair protein MutL [Candidatus Heimdallarchaeota archaeon LC_2]